MASICSSLFTARGIVTYSTIPGSCLTIGAEWPKTPDQWLEETAPTKQRGLFKLFLGYAPGVGKTYNMLSEGIRRFSRGENVVIGVVESHGRPRPPPS